MYLHHVQFFLALPICNDCLFLLLVFLWEFYCELASSVDFHCMLMHYEQSEARDMHISASIDI